MSAIQKRLFPVCLVLVCSVFIDRSRSEVVQKGDGHDRASKPEPLEDDYPGAWSAAGLRLFLTKVETTGNKISVEVQLENSAGWPIVLEHFGPEAVLGCGLELWSKKDGRLVHVFHK